MESSKQLPKHWDALVNIFRQASSSKKPVLWVGAGLSVPAGLPTTSDLLKQLNDNVPQQIYPFTPDDSSLPDNSYQRSFSYWIQELIDQNTEACVVDQLANIF